MLSIISDIHLSDGSTSFNVNGDAFKNVLKRNVMDSVLTEENSGGVIKPGKAKEIKIILLGDIFDFVRTDYWLKLDEDKRPWNTKTNGKLDPKTGMNPDKELMKEHYCRVLDGIFNSKDNSAIDFIDTLRYLKKEINNKGMQFAVFYVVGNHDRILNNFPELREKIKKRLGFNDNEIIFGHHFEDIENYKTFAVHGNEFDEHNYGDKLYHVLNKDDSDESDLFADKYYNVQSIGEAVTSELMSGLIYRLKNRVSPAFLEAVMEINNVKPMLNVFSWISWFGKSAGYTSHEKSELIEAFRDSLESLVKTKLADKWDEVKYDFLFHGDLIYYLKWGLSAIEGIDFKKASSLVKVFRVLDTMMSRIKSLFNPLAGDDCQKGAEKLFNGKYRDAQYILMGHTHDAMHVYFNAEIDGQVNMYINTGTYLPLITRWGGAVNPFFVNSNQMTLINIFRTDEDVADDKKISQVSPTLVLWNGIKRKKYH